MYSRAPCITALHVALDKIHSIAKLKKMDIMCRVDIDFISYNIEGSAVWDSVLSLGVERKPQWPVFNMAMDGILQTDSSTDS